MRKWSEYGKESKKKRARPILTRGTKVMGH
jgi:hypothetical protein